MAGMIMMRQAGGKRRSARTGSRRSGHSVVEVALLFPWMFFLFVGALDWGFYSYALICTESAARVAVLYTSSSEATASDAAGACAYVLDEFRRLPNVGDSVTSCSTMPVLVTAQRADQNTTPPSADRSPSSRVTLTYRTIPLIPIPGLLPGQVTITRTAEMRIRG